MSGYEYGLRYKLDTADSPHRDGMTEAEAREWIAEWDEMDGTPGTFVLIRREIGSWEDVDGSQVTS